MKNATAEQIQDLQTSIEQGWEERDSIDINTNTPIRNTVNNVIGLLDEGQLRVATQKGIGDWQVNEWVKKAILLYFKLQPMHEMEGGPEGSKWWDKVPSKFKGWDAPTFHDAGFRAVPHCIARHGSFIGKTAVLMPSFVNIGAYVDEGTMVDTWATVGSCAQVGKNCHISGGTGIGGVLEPLQASPVIIEDNVFIGARSEVAEGVIVEEGAVISMGVFISASTKVIDRESGEVFYGRVPAYSVVIPGTLPGKDLPDGTPGPSLACAVIVKRVDEKTRSKTSINELLRD